MATAKLCTSGTLDAMKPEEGNDTLDTFIKHATGKESLLPFSRTSNNPVPWIQLLHALDQTDFPGWPLLAPVKIQMQKCEKCSLEFCSPINYRRHIRVHRKSLKVNKDSNKNRDLLAAFWDKISLEQAKEVVSFNNVMLKEIPGSSFIEALESSVHKAGIWTLPRLYVKAANALLDIIHASPSGPPQISSQELFSILDGASERTFLCAGTAVSVQKYVFDGEPSSNCLELKNVVACTSFLFERQLVKVWTDDKDAEALRCHKLLVEEEEAAQKRQAMLLEKKRQKKLRKEQKVKEQLYGNMDVNVDAVDRSASAEASRTSSPSATSSNPPDIPTSQDSPLEPTQHQIKESNEEEIETRLDIPNEHTKQGDDSQTTKLHMVDPNGNRNPSSNLWQALPKPRRGSRFGFNPQPLKSKLTMHKSYLSKDRNLQNGAKIWAKKLKMDTKEGENQKLVPPSQGETDHHAEENECEVIIGSISVTLKNSVAKQQGNRPSKMPDERNSLEKSTTANHIQAGSRQVASKHGRPMRHVETKSDLLPLDRGSCAFEGGALSKKVPSRNLSRESSEEQSEYIDRFDNLKRFPFSSAAAKEFLDRRWKEAISSDHVRLVLSEPEPPGSSDVAQRESSTTSSDASNPTENQTERIVQVKISKKQEKCVKVEYIPKQKAAA